MNPLALALPIAFDKPLWLWLALLVPLLVLLSWRSLAGLEPDRRYTALLLRCLVILMVASALAEVVSVRRNTDLTVMFLLDRSNSIPEDQRKAQEDYVAEVSKKALPGDKVGVISFGRAAQLEQLPMKGGYHIEAGRLSTLPNADRTDIGSAIRLAMAMFPHDTSKRIVLLSDGNDNMGDVMTEARNAGASGVPIDVVPIWYRHANEVTFDRLVAPSMVDEREQVPLRIVLESEKRLRGSIDLYQNGEKVAIDPEAARVELQPGSNAFIFRLPVRGNATQRFEARFRPDNPQEDAIEDNNVATSFSFVGGPGKILLLTPDPEMDQPLVDALREEQVEIDMRDISVGSFDLVTMLDYSAIILANVAANTFTEDQQKALVSYVRDSGGGLIMTGGDDSFGAGGWIGSPVEGVMPVDFDIKHKKVIPQGALAIINHSCEIDRGNYWGMEVSRKAVDTVSSRDLFGVIAYGWSPGGVNWEVPMGPASNKSAIKSKIARMQIGDMPDFDAAMDLAVSGFQGVARTAAQKHMIIISDGDPSPPSGRVMQALINMKVTVSTVGIGYGAHVVERTLIDIANKTGGRFYKCTNPMQLPQIFVKESKVVRKPLILEEPFTPRLLSNEADFLTGMFDEGIPQLHGMVLSSRKRDPRVQVVLGHKSEEGEDDPVLAVWQDGLGKAVAFGSGLWPKWGDQWVQWSKFAKLWAQILRWSKRQETPANFDVMSQVNGNEGRVIVEAVDADAGFLNMLQFQSNVVKPDGATVPLSFAQVAPGRYEANFDVDQVGQFISNIGVVSGGQSMGMIHTGISVPFSPEFRDKATNEGILKQIQEASGGRWMLMDPLADEIFSRDFEPTEARKPAWDWTVAWLLLPLFLLDVAVRRLANWLAISIAVELVIVTVLLFGVGTAYNGIWSPVGIAGTVIFAEVVGWTLRWRWIRPTINFFTHTVTALAGRGEHSAAALDKLKDRRGRVLEERREQLAKAGSVEGAVEALASHDRGARFEADESTMRSARGDLADALGGASKSEGPTLQRPSKSDDAAEDATSRLLKAKKRAQQKLDDSQNP